MLSDYRLKRSLLAKRSRELSAQAVEMVLGFRFLLALEIEQFAGTSDFFGQRFDTLRNRFKLNRHLSALPAKSFRLRTCGFHFRLQALCFAICRRHPLFGLRK